MDVHTCMYMYTVYSIKYAISVFPNYLLSRSDRATQTLKIIGDKICAV